MTWPSLLTPPLSSLPHASARTVYEPANMQRPPTPPRSPTKNRARRPTISVDWLGPATTSFTTAQKYCEIMCYLWFGEGPQSTSPRVPSTLQLVTKPAFIQFTQKLLETTAVSQSVIVLSLHYIWKLKQRNRLTAGQPGSEFRVVIAALMAANKFLDDNTYLNKTWSEVSGISLVEVNKMEREFLLGISFELFADITVYQSWVRMMHGLMQAKERDLARHTKRRRVVPISPNRRTVTHYRARSTSPSTRYVPAEATAPVNLGKKRSAADAAFSPLPMRPSKQRPGIEIPTFGPPRSQRSAPGHSPLEVLPNAFASMSLQSGTSPAAYPAPKAVHPPPHPPVHPPALVPAYSLHQSNPRTIYSANMQNSTLQSSYAYERREPASSGSGLAYYRLRSTPIESSDEDTSPIPRPPSSRPLHYYQPASKPFPPPLQPVHQQQHVPLMAQSATSSPFSSSRHTRLPSFDTMTRAFDRERREFPASYAAYPTPVERTLPPLQGHGQGHTPFANAGPAGVDSLSYYGQYPPRMLPNPHPHPHWVSAPQWGV